MTKTGFSGNVRKIFSNPSIPFVVLWMFLTICHMFFKMGTGDDANYATVIPGQGLVNYLIWAYQNWSARTLIDIVMCVNNWLPHLFWRIANPLVITACAYAFYRLAGDTKSAPAAWIACGFMLLYPWQVMDSAGWVTTTAVYLWPTAAALLSLLPVAGLLRGEKPPKRHCILSLAGILYASNMEQILIILLVLLLAAISYSLLCRRRAHWLLWGQAGACLANLVWILASPGPKARFVGEAVSWYPNFGMKSFFSKLELGVSHTLSAVVFSRDFIFFFFSVLLAWLVFLRHKSVLYRVMALVPVLVCSIFGMYQKYTLLLLPQFVFFTEAVGGEGTIALSNANSPAAYLPMLLLYATFALCLVNIYLALGHTPAAAGAVCVVCAGALSRVALGFSPTV